MMKQLGLLLICLLMGCAVQPTASNTTQSGLAASGDTLIPSTTVALQSKAATIPITSTSADAIVQFEKGRELFENLRQGEALEHLRKAILLDTNFAQAHAYAGFLMTGAEALAELDKAEALSGTVPKAERLNILSMVADRRGDDRRVAELTTQLVELLPGDWRAHWYKGMRGRLARSAIHGQALPDAAGLDEVIASFEEGRRTQSDGWRGSQPARLPLFFEEGRTRPSPHLRTTSGWLRTSPTPTTRSATLCWLRTGWKMRRLSSRRRSRCRPGSGNRGEE